MAQARREAKTQQMAERKNVIGEWDSRMTSEPRGRHATGLFIPVSAPLLPNTRNQKPKSLAVSRRKGIDG